MSSIAGTEGKKSYVNISRYELYNIQQMVAPPEERETIWDRKRELQKKSNAKVAQWPNTLAARRKHKEEARSVRLAKLEADRRVNDKKVAKERAVDRQRRIDRANRTIYERTDRMKVLRSKRMSADVLKHRDIRTFYCCLLLLMYSASCPLVLRYALESILLLLLLLLLLLSLTLFLFLPFFFFFFFLPYSFPVHLHVPTTHLSPLPTTFFFLFNPCLLLLLFTFCRNSTKETIQ